MFALSGEKKPAMATRKVIHRLEDLEKAEYAASLGLVVSEALLIDSRVTDPFGECGAVKGDFVSGSWKISSEVSAFPDFSVSS